MDEGDELPISVRSEERAWDILRQLLDGELDPKDVKLDFTEARWAQFRATYRGSLFHKTLTPSVMRGLIEYQNAIYRCVGLLLREDPRISRLTDEEKAQFELVFLVDEGSSELEAAAFKLLETLGGQIIDKVSPEHIVYSLLFLGVALFGSSLFDRYLKHAADKHKKDLDAERDGELIGLVKELVQNNEYKWGIVDRLLKTSPHIQAIQDQSDAAFDAILNNNIGVDEMEVQGRKLSAPTLRRLTQSSRRPSKDVILNGLFQVSNVDAKAPRGFVVRFEEVGGKGRVITANLTDVILADRYGRVIKRATFTKEAINARISARKVGDHYLDAKILKASKPRAKK